MCGIWGVFPTDTKGFFQADAGAIEQAMILTSLRGSHSTGVAMVPEATAKPRVVKTLGGPAFLLNTEAWEKIMDFTVKKAKVIFGHGRYATKGAITAKNAHPFTHEHISLVHNGTIHFGLKDQHDELETEVDSHALCAAIAKKGLVPALSEVYGAYALIVHDAKEGCIYVVRNEERPLHRVVFYDKHIILSEADACRYLATRLGTAQAKVEIFPKNVIFRYDIDTAVWTTDETLKELLEKKYAPTTTSWQDNNKYSQSGGQSKWSNGNKASGITESTFYCDIELLCTKIEPVPESKQFRYYLYDDGGLEYQALSSQNQASRVGELATAKKHIKMFDRATQEVTRFVKFRELVWSDDVKALAANEEKVEEPEPEPEQLVYKTYNNYMLTKKAWSEYVKKGDCCICGGPILESEAENTILTPSKTLICGDCIHKGRHYKFGFGQ